jgi:type IV pilus assembly protein PilO
MTKFSEMPFKAQLGIIVVVAVLITGALYYFYYKSVADANGVAEKKLAAKKQENAQLRPYRDKLLDLDRQIASLKQQIENQKLIVPDEKEAPQFIHMVQNEAAKAGIEIRRYTAKGTTSKEFYTEVPFELELDGPYYSMLNFFERTTHLERIINISSLQVASIARGSEIKTKKKYQYAPGESVVAMCTATTFYSRDASKSAPAAAPAATPAGTPVRR